MSDSDDDIGRLIRGDHRILAVYRGFLGVVYVCRQELPQDTHVYKAIKTFRRSKKLVARGLFARELAYWVALPPHPNVVQAKDADTVNEQLVLEFVPGPTLHSVARRGPVHPRHFLLWAQQIGAGLQFLHANQFVHRDLRPANILIDTHRKLTAKISDLGIGKPLDESATTHTVIGTFRYMAPEVHDAQTDYRSDIFSFGATLFFLLTAREAVPLTTTNLEKVHSPARWVPGLPEEVAGVILKCLARNPTDRYQSMTELIEAMSSFSEWPIEPSYYEHCESHEFDFFADRPDATCPFCRYQTDFKRRQEYVARILAQL